MVVKPRTLKRKLCPHAAVLSDPILKTTAYFGGSPLQEEPIGFAKPPCDTVDRGLKVLYIMTALNSVSTGESG
jgi:hypothetical protein